MTPDALLWLTFGGLLATCFAAIGAKSLREFSRHELEEICRRHNARDRFGEILRRHDHVAVGVENLLVVVTAVLVVAGTYWAWLSLGRPQQLSWTALLADAICLGLILCVVKIWLPWAITRLWAEPFLFHTWRTWCVISWIMTPLVLGARAFDALLHRLAGRTRELPNEETFEEEIRTIVSEGHREGLLEEDAREMIEGVIELGDADVSEIMTPRTDMHMIHIGMSWDEIVQDVIEVGHTRIPVFDKNRDDVIGILYSKDLLPELTRAPNEPRRPIAELLRKPYFVPETKAVDDVLQVFQKKRNHLAVVLDEYGGVSGLVTIEDVLEEIVGEIVDEYDEDLVEEIERINDHTFEALGRAHVDEINEATGLKLPEDDDFDTIGGFVFSELGHIPLPKDTLVWNKKVRITVMEASHRRINRVRLEILDLDTREIA